ncbi:MAG TPA: hypothetical protein VKT80_07745, partial [Chloroflexota bacterium]|nr:hypothetical protein [Chloroflexota bacterium]
YGNLSGAATTTTLVPEFCIRVPNGDTGELNQIVGGNYSLGSPIMVDRSLDLRSKAAVNGVLEARVKAISWLTVGVTDDLNGDPRAALEAFQQALAVFDNVGPVSAPTAGDGKEVFYYFIGREDLFLKQLDDGMQAFRQALTSNPNHARSHLGLGGIYYTRAQATAPAERLQTTDLESAITEYNLAVAGARQVGDTPAEYQAHIAMGSVLRLKGEAYYFRGDYADADGFLDQAISEARAGKAMIAANQYRVLAYADMVVGNASYQKAAIRQAEGDKVASHDWYQQAHDAYQQCIKAADSDPQDLILATQIKNATCVPYDQAVLKALAASSTVP